jgi:hypothetical protein
VNMLHVISHLRQELTSRSHFANRHEQCRLLGGRPDALRNQQWEHSHGVLSASKSSSPGSRWLRLQCRHWFGAVRYEQVIATLVLWIIRGSAIGILNQHLDMFEG